MNRYLLLLLLIVSLMLNSCKEKKTEEPEIILSVSPSSMIVPNLSDEMVFFIQATDHWQVNYESNWFSISPLSGIGADEITVTYTSEPGVERNGNFVVSAAGHDPESITVPFSQAAELGFKVSPAYIEIASKEDSLDVRVTAFGRWSVSEELDWVDLTNSSGDGNGSFELKFWENTGNIARSGHIVVSALDHFPEIIRIYVEQKETLPELRVTPLERTESKDSQGAPFTVFAEGPWTAHADVNERWVKNIIYEQGYIRVLYDVNDGPARTVFITILADGHFPSEIEVSLTQEGNLGDPPEKPGNLSATRVFWDQIDLVWADESDFETGYKVIRRSLTTNWEVIADLDENAKSYSDSDLRSRFNYTYRIVAYNNAGDSDPTLDLTVVTHSPVLSGRLDGEPKSGNIEFIGDADWFSYEVVTPSSYVFFTDLNGMELNDSKIWLFGPNSRTRMLVFDDNSGNGNSSRIIMDLNAGIHYVRVEAVNDGDSGSYTITARAE